jgi:acyl dehydratase
MRVRSEMALLLTLSVAVRAENGVPRVSTSDVAAEWTNVVTVGSRVRTRRTISESDVYLFAGVTGDLHPNHMDEQYMAEGRFAQRVVHGALLVGLMSGASTQYALSRTAMPDSVSLGYDRIRFLAPVFMGDTVTVDYQIDTVDIGRNRAVATISVTNQDGTLVAVGRHVTKYIR